MTGRGGLLRLAKRTLHPAANPEAAGECGALRGRNEAEDGPEAAGLPRLAAVGGCGSEGELCAGHSIRELLAGSPRRVGGRAVNGRGIVGVCAGDERHGVVRKSRRARRRGCAQVKEFLYFAKELVQDGSLEQPAKVLPLDPGVVDAQFVA